MFSARREHSESEAPLPVCGSLLLLGFMVAIKEGKKSEAKQRREGAASRSHFPIARDTFVYPNFALFIDYIFCLLPLRAALLSFYRFHYIFLAFLPSLSTLLPLITIYIPLGLTKDVRSYPG